jgi:hypothetical protein
MNSDFEYCEIQELMKKLADHGYGDLVDKLLSNENKVYTKKGRLNKCGACRLLGLKTKELEQVLDICKNILHKDLGD